MARTRPPARGPEPELLDRVQHTIQDRRLLSAGERLVVAVSGGLDSMVLLDVLHRLAPAPGWQLAVAHFNHQLRGDASDADEAFVRAAAARLGCPCLVGSDNVQAHADQHKVSREMAARALRHCFLARAAGEHGARTVALGHHADDQVETFFLRLWRGGGAEGLAGMRYAAASPSEPGLRLIRPLLAQPRPSLEAYARGRGIEWREDASNAQTDIPRNRLRHELIPWLRREFQPALPAAILRVMDLLGAEADFVGAAARRWLAEASGAPFDSLHPALQRRILQLQFQAGKLPASFAAIERLRAAPGQGITVSPHLRVWRDTDGRVQTERGEPRRFAASQLEVELAGGTGLVEFEAVQIAWQRQPTEPSSRARLAPAPGQEWFDAARVGRRVCLRHWRVGDRFQPIGLAQAVKLQDFFTNRKVPRPERHARLIAVTAEGEVFWVEGERIGERFKLSAATRERLEWRWQRLEPETE